MLVTVYTYTTIRSPNTRSGAIGYLIKAETKVKHEDPFDTELVTDCTGNRAALMAVLAALRRFNKPCSLIIHTDSAYVANGIKEDAQKWQQAGWKNSKGEPTANREEWEECLRLLRDKQVEVQTGKIHEYYFWLRTETRRKAKEGGIK